MKRFTERILSVSKNTDKKENKIFLIYKEIQNGAVANSYMKKGFLIYEEMRKYLTIYEEVVSHILLCNQSLLIFLMYYIHQKSKQKLCSKY